MKISREISRICGHKWSPLDLSHVVGQQRVEPQFTHREKRGNGENKRQNSVTYFCDSLRA